MYMYFYLKKIKEHYSPIENRCSKTVISTCTITCIMYFLIIFNTCILKHLGVVNAHNNKN